MYWTFVFFFKIGKAKKSIGWAKYLYVCVWDTCWRNFCNFPLVTRNVKSSSKIALFSNERHFEIWFQKKRTITFFEVNYLNFTKKDPILHVATTFSLKQGGTRTSQGPIFSKTRGNKNKPGTHSTPLNSSTCT